MPPLLCWHLLPATRWLGCTPAPTNECQCLSPHHQGQTSTPPRLCPSSGGNTWGLCGRRFGMTAWRDETSSTRWSSSCQHSLPNWHSAWMTFDIQKYTFEQVDWGCQVHNTRLKAKSQTSTCAWFCLSVFDLALQVPWARIKVQVFGGLLDETVCTDCSCTWQGYKALGKFHIHTCETGTLNSDLKMQMNTLGNKCLHCIMEHHWMILCKIDDYSVRLNWSLITWIVCECQPQVHGHVTHDPELNPAHWVVSLEAYLVWNKYLYGDILGESHKNSFIEWAR